MKIYETAIIHIAKFKPKYQNYKEFLRPITNEQRVIFFTMNLLICNNHGKGFMIWLILLSKFYVWDIFS